MATVKALNGKPYAGNPRVRFDEGDVASCTAEASLRGTVLAHGGRAALAAAILAFGDAALSPLHADVPSAMAGACNDRVIAFIDTRPCDAGLRPPDNPGGWIETRLCDDDAGLATIDTAKPVGMVLNFR